MDTIATLKGLRCAHCGSEQLTVTGIKGALGAAIAIGAAFGGIGNLVAGSKAAANQATEPLQYKCAVCGYKFETLPLIAPPEDVLAVPCTVTFARESSFVGAAVPQIVYINGVKLGAVKNGKSITFATSNRYNVMFVTDQHGVAFKSECRFEAQPGSNVSVRFNRRFLDVQSLPASVSSSEDTSYKPIGTPTAFEPPPVRFCTNCGRPLEDGLLFCQACGEKRFSSQDTVGEAKASSQKPSAAAQQSLAEKPGKSIWVSGFLVLSWIALLLFQGLFDGRLMFGTDVTFFIVLALLGTGVYQLLQKDLKLKLCGALSGLMASLLSVGSSLGVQLNGRMIGSFSLAEILGFGLPYYWSLFGRALLISALTLGVSAFAGYLMRQKPKTNKMAGAGGVAAGVYALCSLISWLMQYSHNLGHINAAGVFSIMLGILADAVMLFLAVRFSYSLSRKQQSRVRLFGLGKAWAWIATIGMFLSIAVVLGTAFGDFSGIAYTASLLLAIAGTTGYILLLCERRAGLYVLVLAATLILGGQFFSALTGVIYGAGQYAVLLFASIIGAVNPIFAWMAVRAADRRLLMPDAARQPVSSIQQKVSGFQKVASDLPPFLCPVSMLVKRSCVLIHNCLTTFQGFSSEQSRVATATCEALDCEMVKS